VSPNRFFSLTASGQPSTNNFTTSVFPAIAAECSGEFRQLPLDHALGPSFQE
jgi:hypothetical protein